MATFLSELKRRHIYRVAAAYAVVAWVLLQLFNNLEPMLKLPDWMGTFVLVLLLGGFPIALIFAWIHQLVPADGALARAATGKLDWALIGALVVVLAVVSYQQISPTSGARTTQQQASVTTGAANTNGVSIAVLPFVNLSSDKEQEFFSDGMTEEITAALARIQSMRVIGRTSAFQFKGQNEDLRAIGRALGASHLIEGSVRKAGDRVRITAQLIKADDGSHLWTENYDRELTDVFAIQEDIAQAIAGALRVPLGLQAGERLVTNRTTDLESYQQYLRARGMYRARDIEGAIRVLESLVARDRGFAPAWGLLAQAYVQAAAGSLYAKGESAAREAIRSDPRNAMAYSALGDMNSFLAKWTIGEDYFRHALAIDPNEPDVLHRYSARLAVAGRIKEALSIREKLRTLDPFAPIYISVTARLMVTERQTEAAIAALETIPADIQRSIALARALAMEGRYSEAADALLATPPQVAVPSRRSIEDAARLLRSAPQKTGSPESLPSLDRQLNFVYLYVGALDHVLDSPERDLQSHDTLGVQLDVLWQSESAPLRKTERFRKFVRDSGLVDYWRAYGWADVCRPMGADDFVCD
jgi:TolB-like protein